MHIILVLLEIVLCCKSYLLGFDVFRTIFFVLPDLSSDFLCVVTIAYLRQIDRSVTSRTIKSFECESSSSTLQASSHFDHISSYPVFMHQLHPQTLHDQDLIKLWDGKQLRQYLLLVYYQTLGSYFYVMLILPCYARRRGLGLSVFHDRCEIVN